MASKEERTFELSKELLKGSIDIHVHAVPHLRSSPRRVDPFQASIQARDAGMQAIVLMDVIEMTNGIFDDITFIDTHFLETNLDGTIISNLNEMDNNTYDCKNNPICNK